MKYVMILWFQASSNALGAGGWVNFTAEFNDKAHCEFALTDMKAHHGRFSIGGYCYPKGPEPK